MQVSTHMGTCHQGGFHWSDTAQRSWLPGVPQRSVPQRSWVPPEGLDLLLGTAEFKFYPEARQCAATAPTHETFQAKPVSKQPVATLHQHTALPENKECADCGAPAPEWASVNQGVLICIECAGCHRSLGAHLSKVKSVTLDSWKPEEVERFTAKGGNKKVNNDLLRSGGPPPPARGAPRVLIDEYIRMKYGGEKAADDKRSTSPQKSGKTPGLREVDDRMGTTCHQGLVMVDIDSVDIGVERARDLRTLGPFFLSLSVQLSLGSQTSEPTSHRRGSEKAEWSVPERRQLLWDAQERYLWCRVWDGEFSKQLAAEGRIDLLKHLEGSGSEGIAETVEVELFAPQDDCADSDSEAGEASPNSTSTAATLSKLQDPSLGAFIGRAKLKLDIIDMTGMLKTQARKPISQSTWGSSSSD